MPRSLSHVVLLTEDLEGTIGFLTGIGKVSPVNMIEATDPDGLSQLLGWPHEHSTTRSALIGEGPGSIDLVEIPAALRGQVQPGLRLLGIASRDAAGAAAEAAAQGHRVRGPMTTVTAIGNTATIYEVSVGGLPFELIQFGG